MYHIYSTDIHIESFTRQPNDQQCILQEKCLAIAEEESEGLIWVPLLPYWRDIPL